MNENKTAITEMREYTESWLDSGTEYSRGQIIEAMVNKARALEASQAEKDKGDELVEALLDVESLHIYKMDNSVRTGVHAMYDAFAKRFRHEKGAK